MRIATIGVYGFDAAEFRSAVEHADIDLFLDIRIRRGVRGAQYSFASSARLQAMLQILAIPYRHQSDLAPTKAIKQAQEQIDDAQRISRRNREELSSDFIAAYEQEILDGFDSEAFLESLLLGVESIMLFCVEGAPAACHRSLVADRLARDLGAEVVHILPPNS